MSFSNEKKNVRKRPYRQRVKCEMCNKVIDSDYKGTHVSKIHNGEKVKFSVVVEANQMQLTGFLMGSIKRFQVSREESDDAGDEQENEIIDDTTFFQLQDSQEREKNLSEYSDDVMIAEDKCSNDNAMILLLPQVDTNSISTCTSVCDESPKETTEFVDALHPPFEKDFQTMSTTASGDNVGNSTATTSEQPVDKTTYVNRWEERNSVLPSGQLECISSMNQSLTENSTHVKNAPKQPILKEYNPKKYGN
jgi:hypothetical protein